MQWRCRGVWRRKIGVFRRLRRFQAYQGGSYAANGVAGRGGGCQGGRGLRVTANRPSRERCLTARWGLLQTRRLAPAARTDGASSPQREQGSTRPKRQRGRFAPSRELHPWDLSQNEPTVAGRDKALRRPGGWMAEDRPAGEVVESTSSRGGRPTVWRPLAGVYGLFSVCAF